MNKITTFKDAIAHGKELARLEAVANDWKDVALGAKRAFDRLTGADLSEDELFDAWQAATRVQDIADLLKKNIKPEQSIPVCGGGLK